jgi:hypothetical protein
MSRTITAWAVVQPDGHIRTTWPLRKNAEVSASLGEVVVELTGELPDPPKTVTVDGTTWVWDEQAQSWGAGIARWAYGQSDCGKAFNRIWELENGGAS